MDNKRPVGVTIIGIVLLIYSIWLLIASDLIYFLPIPTIRKSIAIFVRAPLSSFFFFFRGAPLITGSVAIVYLVCSIGILSLKNWARLLTIYFSTLLTLPCVYATLVIIIAQIKGELEGPGAIGYGFLILILIPFIPFLIPLIFLTRPKVKEQFKYPVLGAVSWREKVRKNKKVILTITIVCIVYICLDNLFYYKTVKEAINRQNSRPIELLINTLKDKDRRLHYPAVEALIKRGTPAVAPLIAALKNENADMRMNAAHALGVIKDRSAVEPLISTLGDEDSDVRSMAVWALGNIGDSRAVEPLTALSLKEEDRHIRDYVIVNALQDIKYPRSKKP